MGIDQVHDIILTLLRKDNGGYVPHEDIDNILNRVQYDYFEELKPAYGASQQVHDYLKPFRAKLTLTNSNTANGVVTLPDDYFHLLVINSSLIDGDGHQRYVPLEEVNDDEVNIRRDSALTPVNSDYPIFTYDTGSTIQVYPDQAFAGELRYLRKPATCKYGYTIQNDRPVFDSGSSTDLEWNEFAQTKIIEKAVALLGLTTQDSSAVQMMAAKGGNNAQ